VLKRKLSITVVISRPLSFAVISHSLSTGDRQSLSPSKIPSHAGLAPFRNRQPNRARSNCSETTYSTMSASMVSWTTLVSVLAMALGSAVDDPKPNTVFVAILIRNKAHTLPYFFSALESLDYPKDRMHLWYVIELLIKKKNVPFCFAFKVFALLTL